MGTVTGAYWPVLAALQAQASHPLPLRYALATPIAAAMASGVLRCCLQPATATCPPHPLPTSHSSILLGCDKEAIKKAPPYLQRAAAQVPIDCTALQHRCCCYSCCPRCCYSCCPRCCHYRCHHRCFVTSSMRRVTPASRLCYCRLVDYPPLAGAGGEVCRESCESASRLWVRFAACSQ